MKEEFIKRIIRHEGLKLKPYRCTAGKLTIGIGRNLDDVGITESEARYLLENDLQRCHRECLLSFSWYADLDEARQSVICEMCFNLGLARLKAFKKMLKAVEMGNFAVASQEMLTSKWAMQVGNRAKTLADVMKRGIV